MVAQDGRALALAAAQHASQSLEHPQIGLEWPCYLLQPHQVGCCVVQGGRGKFHILLSDSRQNLFGCAGPGLNEDLMPAGEQGRIGDVHNGIAADGGLARQAPAGGQFLPAEELLLVLIRRAGAGGYLDATFATGGQPAARRLDGEPSAGGRLQEFGAVQYEHRPPVRLERNAPLLRHPRLPVRRNCN